MDLTGANLALGAARQHVNSARPDAPVVPDRRSDRGGRGGQHRPRHHPGPVRRAVAYRLRRLADRLEPACP